MSLFSSGVARRASEPWTYLEVGPIARPILPTNCAPRFGGGRRARVNALDAEPPGFAGRLFPQERLLSRKSPICRSAEVVRWARSVQGLLARARPLDLPLPAASGGRLPEAEGDSERTVRSSQMIGL
jgi:hypothetical protein